MTRKCSGRRCGSVTLQDTVMNQLRSELDLEGSKEKKGVKQWREDHRILSDEPTGLEVWRIFYEAVERDSTPDTPHLIKLKKTTYLVYLFMTMVSSIAGAVFSALGGFMWAAFVDLLYIVLTAVCIKATMKYNLFKYSTLLFRVEVMLPFVIQLAVGGFVRSGGVMIWALIAPLGVALVQSPKRARPYLYTYVLNVILACLFEQYGPVAEENRLHPLDIFILGMNYTFMAATIFTVGSVFASNFHNEHTLAEGLLVNMFPLTIAERLKKGENPIVDNVDCVTILFANVVGFDHATSCMNPKFLVGKVLRDMYSAFDHLVDARGLEKIKTSGDIYIAVGGLNDSSIKKDNQNSVAHEVVQLAFEFQDVLQEIFSRDGISFQIQIGLHTGPVIAGVLGVNRFAFDVWGDSCNTASRMETSGLPGKVHVSSDTYERIKGYKHLECLPCKAMQIKGKGMMQTYMVTLRRHSDSHDVPFGIRKPIATIVAEAKGPENVDVGRKSSLELELESPIDESPFDNPNVAKRDSLWYHMALCMSRPDTAPSELVKRETSVVVWIITVVVCSLFTPLVWKFADIMTLLLVDGYVALTAIAALLSMRYKTFLWFETFYMVFMFLISIIPTWVEGGMREYHSSVIWLFVFPLGSALVHTPLKAQRWFAVYLVSTILFRLYGERYGKAMISATEVAFFAINNIGTFTGIFTVVHLYATELTREHSYSESLLLNALPVSVARRLRSGESPIVDHVDGTSILLADLVGFTKASSTTDAKFLVGQFLRDIFFEFDKAIEKRNLEKIKTIGDAIMVVGGLNGERSPKHTVQLVLLATEFHEKLLEVNTRYGTSFGLRIGVHTGPLIAGVLGAKRFRYDVWGETVRMVGDLEANCVPGLTHISAATYDAIKDFELFDYRDGGGLSLEAHIQMKTYLVTRSKASKHEPKIPDSEAVEEGDRGNKKKCD